MLAFLVEALEKSGSQELTLEKDQLLKALKVFTLLERNSLHESS